MKRAKDEGAKRFAQLVNTVSPKTVFGREKTKRPTQQFEPLFPDVKENFSTFKAYIASNGVDINQDVSDIKREIHALIATYYNHFAHYGNDVYYKRYNGYINAMQINADKTIDNCKNITQAIEDIDNYIPEVIANILMILDVPKVLTISRFAKSQIAKSPVAKSFRHYFIDQYASDSPSHRGNIGSILWLIAEKFPLLLAMPSVVEDVLCYVGKNIPRLSNENVYVDEIGNANFTEKLLLTALIKECQALGLFFNSDLGARVSVPNKVCEYLKLYKNMKVPEILYKTSVEDKQYKEQPQEQPKESNYYPELDSKKEVPEIPKPKVKSTRKEQRDAYRKVFKLYDVAIKSFEDDKGALTHDEKEKRNAEIEQLHEKGNTMWQTYHDEHWEIEKEKKEQNERRKKRKEKHERKEKRKENRKEENRDGSWVAKSERSDSEVNEGRYNNA